MSQQLQFAVLDIKGDEMFFPRPFVRLQIDPCQFAQTAVRMLREQIQDGNAAIEPVAVKPVLVESSYTKELASVGQDVL
jgi:hypothetical protein